MVVKELPPQRSWSTLTKSQWPLEAMLGSGHTVHSIVFSSSGRVVVNFHGTSIQDILNRGRLGELRLKRIIAKVHPAYQRNRAKKFIMNPFMKAEELLLALNRYGLKRGVGILQCTRPAVEGCIPVQEFRPVKRMVFKSTSGHIGFEWKCDTTNVIGDYQPEACSSVDTLNGDETEPEEGTEAEGAEQENK